MKIGVDAKWFYDGPVSGTVVIRNLLKHLADLPGDDEFYIFLDLREKGKAFPYQRANVHLIYVWAGNNMLSNIFVIPFSARKLKLDVFIFQNFSPLFSNFKRYAYIHDVLFKTHPQFYTSVERLYLSPLKTLTRFAHRLCTVSKTEKQRMIGAGYGKEELIDVVYHGVDEAFMPRERQNADALQRVAKKYSLPSQFILYVGRLNVRKNVFNLLCALPLLKNTSIPLVVVGGYDWKMTSADGLLADLGIAERVIFTGPVYGDDIPLIYSLASVFCFVSFAESFGLPALEGMASGVPVVVSDRTCLPEICGDAALYANPDKPAEIAERVDQLLEDEELWMEKKQLGINRARNFHWRISAERLLDSARKAMGKEPTN